MKIISSETHLPPEGAFFGKFLEDDVLIGVLLLVLLAARLYEEGVRGHTAPRLGRLRSSLVLLHNCVILLEIILMVQLLYLML